MLVRSLILTLSQYLHCPSPPNTSVYLSVYFCLCLHFLPILKLYVDVN